MEKKKKKRLIKKKLFRPPIFYGETQENYF